VFPEAWRAFAGFLPEVERGDLLGNYHRRLINTDPAVHLPAAHAWSRYEGSCSTLLPDPELVAHFDDDAVALAIARIEAHFFVNHIFLPDNSLLNNLQRIRHLPCTIIQGRYDAVCPIVSADDLHRAWPAVTPNTSKRSGATCCFIHTRRRSARSPRSRSPPSIAHCGTCAAGARSCRCMSPPVGQRTRARCTRPRAAGCTSSHRRWSMTHSPRKRRVSAARRSRWVVRTSRRTSHDSPRCGTRLDRRGTS